MHAASRVRQTCFDMCDIAQLRVLAALQHSATEAHHSDTRAYIYMLIRVGVCVCVCMYISRSSVP